MTEPTTVPAATDARQTPAPRIVAVHTPTTPPQRTAAMPRPATAAPRGGRLVATPAAERPVVVPAPRAAGDEHPPARR